MSIFGLFNATPAVSVSDDVVEVYSVRGGVKRWRRQGRSDGQLRDQYRWDVFDSDSIVVPLVEVVVRAA